MEKFKLISIFLFLPFLFTYQINQGQKAEPIKVLHSTKVQKTNKLEGIWKLQKAKWGDMEDFREETRSIIKIYTQGYVFFIYNKEGAFNGAGGGTYTATDETFTETLTYFSWDSTAAGTAQTFNYEIKDDVLHQFGKMSSEEYQDYAIDEYYQRVEDKEKKNELVGVWEATKVAYGDQQDSPLDHNMRLIKAITPSHFYAVTYNPLTGAFDHATHGTYSYLKGKLRETIHTTSRDQEATGKMFEFTVKKNKDGFTQKGMVNTPDHPNFKIVEKFKRLE